MIRLITRGGGRGDRDKEKNISNRKWVDKMAQWVLMLVFWTSEFQLWDPHGERREPVPINCSLISTSILEHVHIHMHAYTHAYTQALTHTKKKCRD